MTLSATVIDFLTRRAIDPELADKLGCDSCKAADGGDQIVFPYVVGNDILNHKYRRISEKRFRQDPGAPQIFWNFNVIVDPTLAEQPLVITEGELDALVAIQCGYVRTVSVPSGAPIQSQLDREDARKYLFVEHARTALRDVKEIILAVDSDANGQALLNDLSIKLGKARCKFVRYPKGCKDLNDSLIAYGERGVHEVFRRAQWCKVAGVYRMSELPPYPVRERYTTGMDFLDKHYRIRMGDLCVITGVPGHGKSTFVSDIICRMADEHAWRIAVASFEQHPRADHQRALREWYTGMPECDDLGRSIMTAEDMVEADRWIDEHFVFIVPDDDDLANLAWSLEKCAAAVVRYGVRLVVIDPWNELDHDKPPDMSLTEYTGKAIKEFKRLARSLDVHVIVVAHPTKMSAGEVPSLYSVSDSAHWANKPDVGLVVWKPSTESNYAEVRIMKSRYHDQIGRPGIVGMRYERMTRRFEEAESDDDE